MVLVDVDVKLLRDWIIMRRIKFLVVHNEKKKLKRDKNISDIDKNCCVYFVDRFFYYIWVNPFSLTH